MRRTRLTITLKEGVLSQIDALIDGERIRNRSHGIEYILSQYFKPTIKKAVILSGGKGRHLRPYTYELPKSLLPIQGKPILYYLIRRMKEAGVREIVMCVGYLGEKIKEYCGDGSKFGVRITYSEEKKPLGTGGAIRKIKSLVKDDPFLLFHGDILFELNLSDLVNFHQQQDTITTVTLLPTRDPSPFGQFELHGTTIVDFHQNVKKREEKSYLINTGMYVMNPAIFNFFPPGHTPFMIEEVLYNLAKDKKLSGFVFEGEWFDVGTPKSYGEAIKQFKTTLFPDQK